MKTTKVHELADFNGKNIYVGIDLHKKDWSVTIYFDKIILKRFTQPGSVKSLAAFLKREYPNADYLCGYESGFCGFEVQRRLEELGIKCQVLHAADIPQTNKEKIEKTDRVDSRKIAKALSESSGNSIYIPDRDNERDRNLIRYYLTLKKDTARAKNRIKSLLNSYYIEIPEQIGKNWSKNFIQWLKENEEVKDSARAALNLMISQLEHIRLVYLEATKEVRKLQNDPKHKKLMELLTSITGIGPLIAIILITEIMDMKRFENKRKLNSYVGLMPMEHSSGEQEHKGKITVKRNKFLRAKLIEAAWISIRHDPALSLAYHELTKHMTGKRAITRIARKLLNRIRCVWLNETVYQKNVTK